MRKVIYIAGPFRSTTYYGQVENIRRAEAVALEVWRAGAAALCPHLNTQNFQGALHDEVWLEGDLALLHKCDAILMMERWDQSRGAREERFYAMLRRMPILYGIEDCQRWLVDQKQAA